MERVGCHGWNILWANLSCVTLVLLVLVTTLNASALGGIMCILLMQLTNLLSCILCTLIRWCMLCRLWVFVLSIVDSGALVPLLICCMLISSNMPCGLCRMLQCVETVLPKDVAGVTSVRSCKLFIRILVGLCVVPTRVVTLLREVGCLL